MSDPTRAARPEYRNINISQIVSYRLPLAGILSIAHRITGAALFLLLPYVLWLFEKSLTSEGTFATFKSVTSHWFAKLVILALLLAYLIHFFAGIRHLFMDVHLGLEKKSGATSAAVVFAIALVYWLAIVLKTYGAF